MRRSISILLAVALIISLLGSGYASSDEMSVTDLLMLHSALSENVEDVIVLIEEGADVNARGENGVTPLMFPAGLGVNPEAINLLLTAGADVNAEGICSVTPLMMAAGANENPEVIMALLRAGADGKARDIFGRAAFDYAQQNASLKGTVAYQELNDAMSK